MSNATLVEFLHQLSKTESVKYHYKVRTIKMSYIIFITHKKRNQYV